MLDDFIESIKNCIQAEHSKVKCEIYAGSGSADIKFYCSSKNKWLLEKQLKGAEHEESYSKRGRLACLFYFEKHKSDKSDVDYWNLCTIEVSLDGTYQIDYAYKPELDEAKEQDIIASIGQNLYDKFQREDQERCEADMSQSQIGKAEQPELDEPVYSIPELLGFMVEEVSKDMPAGWQQLRINAEVIEEQGKQAVSATYECHTGDQQWQAFSASNTIGPMNAVMKLQQLMQQEGQTWHEAILTFSSDGSVSIDSK